MIRNRLLHTGILPKIRSYRIKLSSPIILLCLLPILTGSILGTSAPAIPRQHTLHSKAVVCLLRQFRPAITRFQNKLCRRHRCQNPTGFHILCTQHSNPLSCLLIGKPQKHRSLRPSSFPRHSSLHSFPESRHRIRQSQTFPQMLRISMICCNSPCVSLSMGNHHTICQRIQTKLLTKLGNQFHRCFIRPHCRCSCLLQIRAGKARSAGILDTGRLTHLHTNMRVISASLTTGTTMPSPVIPWQCLIHSSIIPINKTMHTGTSKRSIIPGIKKDLCPRLRTSNRMKHQALHCNHSPCSIAGIFCQKTLNQSHSPSLPSPLSCSCSSTSFIFCGIGSPRCPAFSSKLTPSLEI